MTEADVFISKIAHMKGSDFLCDTITPLETLKQSAKDQMKWKMELFVTHLQTTIVNELSKYELTKTFIVDRWEKESDHGGGITCVLQNGDVFEKAGVNISVVHGELSEGQAKSMRSRGKDLKLEGKNMFFATGISSVIHPVNPNIPTFHFNYRYFEVVNEPGDDTWWFGGGLDMTPNYLFEEEITEFHRLQKEVCDKHNDTYHKKFKTWADNYFYNKHRGEHRGVGGLFFDDLDEGGIDACFSFVASCGNAILPSYTPMIEKHKDDVYTEKQRNWQLIRRGKYVEFNLVYDRGTQFGLATPSARIESVLISLPLNARWEYIPKIEPNSPEEKMMAVLITARDWV